MKAKTVIITVLLALVVLVNSITAVTLYKKISSSHKATDNSTDTAESTEDQAVSYFGKPIRITVFGNGKEYTVDNSSPDFQKILEYNEKAMLSAPSLGKVEQFDYKTLKAYGVKYVYGEDYTFNPKNHSSCSIRELVFILTGEHHGTIAYDSSGSLIILGGLVAQPEYNELIVNMLN